MYTMFFMVCFLWFYDFLWRRVGEINWGRLGFHWERQCEVLGTDRLVVAGKTEEKSGHDDVLYNWCSIYCDFQCQPGAQDSHMGLPEYNEG